MRILIPVMASLLAACTGEPAQGTPSPGAVLVVPVMVGPYHD